MNNLLVLFILLYAISAMDLEKFKTLMSSFGETFGKQTEVTASEPSDPASEVPYERSDDLSDPEEVSDPEEESAGGEVSHEESEPETPGESGIMDDLDEFYHKISTIIEEKGYTEKIIVEKVDQYIYFRFKEGVLFEPDRAVLKPDSFDALSFVADVIKEAYAEIAHIDISGHTAWVSEDDDKNNFASWQLSCKRSLTVLEFLVSQCDIPKLKMTATGYSSTLPYSTGTTEEEKQLNRRVEIRISRLIDEITKGN